MRTLILVGFLICSGGVTQAQEPRAPQEPPGVMVVKYSWSKERINWEKDPFGGAVENFDDMRRRIADQRRLERARAGGAPGEATKIEREMRSEEVIKARPSAPPRYVFLYKISIRNGGQKTIKEVDWDYIFSGAATGQELDRREFTGVERIGPGKSKELSFQITAPPTKTISTQALNKKEREGLGERVIIVRVLYEDGTVWQR